MTLSLNELTLRLATPEDVDKIVALVESVYRGEGSKRGWTTEADLLDGQRTDPEMIDSLIREPQSFLYLMQKRDGTLAASVHLKIEKDFGYIGMVSVHTLFQNQKLGKKLLQFCEQKIIEFGLQIAKLTVLEPRRELIAWYERYGYKKTGMFLDFPKDPRYGLSKIGELRLVELSKNLTRIRD